VLKTARTDGVYFTVCSGSSKYAAGRYCIGESEADACAEALNRMAKD